MRFGHLAQRLFNVPLAIHPGKAEVIMTALADRLGVASLLRLEGTGVKPMAFDESDDFREPARDSRARGYELVEGVAVIDISGTLVQKLGTLRPYSGMMGYDGIRQNVLTALADPDVKALALDIDSPGGEVAGCFDLVDTIYKGRGDKPIWAILDEAAYSAAYAIASAADYITVPRTGGTGSIGVIAMHIDWSEAISKAGAKVTIITHGARKADGHPEIPLSDEALANYQSDIDSMGELFVETVARNRNMAASKVRDMQAACFLGTNGVSQGLADAVMAPDASFLALLDKLA